MLWIIVWIVWRCFAFCGFGRFDLLGWLRNGVKAWGGGVVYVRSGVRACGVLYCLWDSVVGLVRVDLVGELRHGAKALGAGVLNVRSGTAASAC